MNMHEHASSWAKADMHGGRDQVLNADEQSTIMNNGTTNCTYTCIILLGWWSWSKMTPEHSELWVEETTHHQPTSAMDQLPWISTRYMEN